MTITTSTTRPSRRDLTNVQLVTREWHPRKPMSDHELLFREGQARRAMRRNDDEEENTPLWLVVLGALTITGILPAVICPLLFGFGLD